LKIEAFLFVRAPELPALDEVNAPKSGGKRYDKNPSARIAAKEDPDDPVVFDFEYAGKETIERCHPQEFCMCRQWRGTAACI
jgi:hypothetical protein